MILHLSEALSLCCFVFPDVYSYDEDDMVLDSKLPEHLAHFGIDMMTMEKVSFVFLLILFWICSLIDQCKFRAVRFLPGY